VVGFSQRAEGVIADFGASIDMPGLPRSPDGSYTIAFQRAGVMSLTPSQDGKRTIVSLTRKPAHPPLAEDLKRLFDVAQLDPVTRFPVSAGLSADNAFILAMSVDDADFTLQSLEAAIDRLIQLFEGES
ncbi:MAG: CesT family type III secretion system chaperone, partial [Pseudomonadota bacterium]